ncbi:MAG: cellulase family glycosylhydrolase [Lachnoclostridium sp.]|nr:cellulase family glycosylhydrolase [Lachnospira sp.]MCM1248458.1 cellulase family glycosylhydrolase [Lachnoclostridium sp.]MCM1536417.1 cellulase family glycosylhydrolase [Clostridium sp.]
MDTESTKSAEDKKTSAQGRLPFLIGGAVIIVLLIALIAVIAENSALRRAALSNSADSLQAQEGMSQADASHTDAADNTDAPAGDNSQASGAQSLQNTGKPAAGDGYTVTYSAGNGWTDGDTKMCSLELRVTNNSDTTIEGWNLALQVDGLVSAQGWDGTWSVDGDVVSITNAEYNKTIAPGASVVLGCNMGTKTDLSIVSAALNDAGCNVEKGNVDRNAQNNNQQNGNGQVKGKDVSELLARSENAVQGDDWLFTDGNKIVDKDGKQVWLTGVNWFGYNTGTNTFDGLWNSQLVPTVKAIADHGFNLIRVPMSAELINQWAAGEYPRANYNNAYNEELNAMNSLEIFDYFLALAEENGIKVMIDIHSAETNASGHTVNLWYTDKVTVEDYYAALEWMAERYKDNDTVIAYDLKNEPHGKPNEGKNAAVWNDSKDANNWKYVAETAAAKVLSKNPNVLILVEGTEIYPVKKGGDYSSTDSGDYYFNWWGGNLRAVADYPIDLGKYQNKLVYSPHDYGPTVYEQPWFQKNYTYDSLMEDCWGDNWFYIYEEDIAPLLIGEWGGFMREPNLTWMTYMRQLIGTYHLNHTFWCLNANSGDTGGLLLDDFTTWDSEKYNFVKEVLWQESGKFVGLDHAIPLGENGITLEEAKGLK